MYDSGLFCNVTVSLETAFLQSRHDQPLMYDIPQRLPAYYIPAKATALSLEGGAGSCNLSLALRAVSAAALMPFCFSCKTDCLSALPPEDMT